MANIYKGNKSLRILYIYERLINGELLNKSYLAIKFGVDKKTVQRDIKTLRTYFSINHPEGSIVVRYDKRNGGYCIIKSE